MNKRPLIPALALLLAANFASAADLSDWYPFTPTNDNSAQGIIGLNDWNNEPAGLYGRITRRGDELIYNGHPIKLWGTNIGFANSAPDKEKAASIVAFYKRFGLNTLRHHKHLDGPGWQGVQSEKSFVKFEPEGLDRFDYFNHLLKEAGIYIKHSPTFGVKFGRDDVERIPYWQEIGSFRERPNARIKAEHGWIFLSTELQDLQIEQTVNFLNHRNPYTGMRYAEDPFLFCVELFNEDSALFGATNGRLQASPTIRKRIADEFTDWLQRKYGNEAAWQAAWGAEAVIDNPQQISNGHLRNMVGPDKIKGPFPAESFQAGSIVPWYSSWFADAAVTEGSDQAFLKQRMLDTMQFMIGLQDSFYERFTTAIRQTGFEGEIIRSNWQAGSLVGHLLNLYSDAQTGMVDRHNYYKGGGFRGLELGKEFNKFSLLHRPGGGNYSVGFQQVEGAAFMLSEWTHEQPNEYAAEGPVIMGAYGWGLQGWDVSYHFLFGARDGFSNRLGINTWDANNPAMLATFPIVSRMVRRMDIQESPETFLLKAHRPSLLKGQMSFRGETFQNRDQKLFSSDKAPVEALAATRVAIDFTETYQETPDFDLDRYMEGDTVVAANQQLRWTKGKDSEPNSGHVVIQSKQTKGFVGFSSGEETFDLGDGFSITPGKGFSVILLTARNETGTLLNGDDILLVAMARARNSGMRFNETENVILDKGDTPIVLEPVTAAITLPFDGTLDLLDHDGIAATSSRPFQKTLQMNGTQDRSPFYRIRR